MTRKSAAEVARLEKVIATIDAERRASQSAKARREELTQPWPVFIRRMRLLTAQAWGTRVQNYLVRFYGWSTIPQSDDTGDARAEEGKLVEIKATMITGSNRQANFVQLRPHQEIDGYRMFVVDEAYKVWRFDLSKEQMAEEIALIGTSAHGTKEAVLKNPNKEHAVRFQWNENPIRERWLERYHVSGVTPDQMGLEYRDAAALP